MLQQDILDFVVHNKKKQINIGNLVLVSKGFIGIIIAFFLLPQQSYAIQHIMNDS